MKLTKYNGMIDYNRTDNLIQICNTYWICDQCPDTNDILKVLDPKGAYYVHHTATRRAIDFGGYINACVQARYLPYTGRFGTGYVCVTNKTNMYVHVTYLIKKRGDSYD